MPRPAAANSLRLGRQAPTKPRTKSLPYPNSPQRGQVVPDLISSLPPDNSPGSHQQLNHSDLYSFFAMKMATVTRCGSASTARLQSTSSRRCLLKRNDRQTTTCAWGSFRPTIRIRLRCSVYSDKTSGLQFSFWQSTVAVDNIPVIASFKSSSATAGAPEPVAAAIWQACVHAPSFELTTQRFHLVIRRHVTLFNPTLKSSPQRAGLQYALSVGSSFPQTSRPGSLGSSSVHHTITAITQTAVITTTIGIYIVAVIALFICSCNRHHRTVQPYTHRAVIAIRSPPLHHHKPHNPARPHERLNERSHRRRLRRTDSSTGVRIDCVPVIARFEIGCDGSNPFARCRHYMLHAGNYSCARCRSSHHHHLPSDFIRYRTPRMLVHPSSSIYFRHHILRQTQASVPTERVQTVNHDPFVNRFSPAAIGVDATQRLRRRLQ